MTYNIKNNKNQQKFAIENELKFDKKISLYSATKDPLPVVTVRLRGGKKQKETIIAEFTCLWDSGATNIMIKRKHTEHYDLIMRSNTVEYSTSAGLYCTTHDVKVAFLHSRLF